jgi:hypothetical protein
MSNDPLTPSVRTRIQPLDANGRSTRGVLSVTPL